MILSQITVGIYVYDYKLPHYNLHIYLMLSLLFLVRKTQGVREKMKETRYRNIWMVIIWQTIR